MSRNAIVGIIVFLVLVTAVNVIVFTTRSREPAGRAGQQPERSPQPPGQGAPPLPVGGAGSPSPASQVDVDKVAALDPESTEKEKPGSYVIAWACIQKASRTPGADGERATLIARARKAYDIAVAGGERGAMETPPPKALEAYLLALEGKYAAAAKAAKAHGDTIPESPAKLSWLVYRGVLQLSGGDVESAKGTFASAVAAYDKEKGVEPFLLGAVRESIQITVHAFCGAPLPVDDIERYSEQYERLVKAGFEDSLGKKSLRGAIREFVGEMKGGDTAGAITRMEMITKMIEMSKSTSREGFIESAAFFDAARSAAYLTLGDLYGKAGLKDKAAAAYRSAAGSPAGDVTARRKLEEAGL